MALLDIHHLIVHYGLALVLDNVNLEVRDLECVGVIGPNGAGKTTLLRSISGIKDWNGSIKFNDQNLKNMSARDIVKLGIVQAPEGRHLFPRLTLQENLSLGAFLLKDKGKISANFEYVMNLFPPLRERKAQLAGTLSGGEQQMTCIGRALMCSPKFLMLDEPSFGLAPLIKEAIADAVSDVQERGVTILLVEQDARMAFELSDRIYVIEDGTIAMNGNTSELSDNPKIKNSYLGID